MPNFYDWNQVITERHANRSEHDRVERNHHPAFLTVVVWSVTHLISPYVLNLNISHTMRTVNG